MREVSRTDWFSSTMFWVLYYVTNAIYTTKLKCACQYGTAPAVLPVIFPLKNITLCDRSA